MAAHSQQLPVFLALTLVGYNASATVLYVDVTSVSPTPPFSDWSTAATNIQDAIDAASPGDQILVTNGVYQTGGGVAAFMTNRVALTKPLTVQSVNGPAVTIIQGYQVPGTTNGSSAVRCAYLTNDAALIGFTLTNGATGLSSFGGGAWCQSASAVLSNCVLTGNTAIFGGGAYGGTINNCTLVGNHCIGSSGNNRGGGAANSILNNCTLSDNSALDGGGASGGVLNGCVLAGNIASQGGGGVRDGVLTNCVVTGNSALFGGGVAGGKLVNSTIVGNSASAYSGGAHEAQSLLNCIVYYNNAPFESDINFGGGTVNSCCITSLPSLPNKGAGNITNEPAFVDLANGDLHLQSNSPCINAGTNLNASASSDLDGNSRIAGGTVDIGAYEFQTPASTISYAWLQRYGLSADTSSDNSDPDGDGLTNWQEWRAGTDPTNGLSVLRLLSATGAAPGVAVTWQSVSGKTYVVERASYLGAQPDFLPLATNIVGQANTNATTYTDTNISAFSLDLFYRVGVQ